MQIDAKGCMVMESGPGRARLKAVRTRPPKALSAHLFFVASCRNLWRHTLRMFQFLLGFVCHTTCGGRFERGE
jgi:hypothetical protein